MKSNLPKKVFIVGLISSVLVTADCQKQSGDEATGNRTSVQPARMTGIFQYMADAGSFTDCVTGRTLPVAHEGDNAALERAYLGTGVAAPDPVLVTLEGSVAERPAVDGGGMREFLVVHEFSNIWPGETCEKSTVETSLTTTYWKLVRLNGDAIESRADEREVHLLLEAGETRVRGFAGCNNFFGGYTIGEGRLSFGELASTMMACPYLDEETAFLEALGRVTAYEILGESLELRGEDGTRVRFKAVYFE